MAVACAYNRFTVLHPHFKTEYFEDLSWEEDWIKEVERLARETLDRDYAPPSSTPDTSISPRKRKVKGGITKAVRFQLSILCVADDS